MLTFHFYLPLTSLCQSTKTNATPPFNALPHETVPDTLHDGKS